MAESKTILLVDDDNDFVESNRDLLEAYGYQVLTAYDGASGFETAKRERPDLMVLDVMMAHATEGFEIARKIKEESELQDLKVLLVSGITGDMSLSFRLEADQTWLPVERILEKPINPARFIAEIEKVLKKE
jgi:two-component system alkaline phosphatase synthesis response regulator PhoP